MCLDESHKPTKQEVATIKFGWKVFRLRHKKLVNMYCTSYEYEFDKPKAGWFTAELNSNEAGFHVFLNEEDAKFVAERQGEGYVAKKVEIRQIILIGISAGMGGFNGKPALTCKKIHICD
jgi:hypothetical protein